MDNPNFSKQYPNQRNQVSMPEQRYDARTVQAAQSRQMTSLQGSKRFVPQTNPNNPPAFKALKSQVAASFAAEVAVVSPYNSRDDSPEYPTAGSSNTTKYYDYPERKPEIHSEGRPLPVAAPDRPTGLRHFSTKVCEKVKQKGLTNYNEVADELVAEYFESNMLNQVDVVKQEYDMKNIRRRVYDALNVLLAMNIITKNKKDIRWVGLPASSAQEIIRLEDEKGRRETSIRGKLETLQEQIVQLITYKNLIAKNRQEEEAHGHPDQQSLLQLPFLIVNTDKEAMVDCSVSSDKTEYLFSFDKRFELLDDLEVLKKLGLACGLDTGDATPEQIEVAKSHLPPLIRPYIDDILAGHKRLEAERIENEKKMAEEEREFYEKMEAETQLRLQQEYEQNAQLEAQRAEEVNRTQDITQSTSAVGNHLEGNNRQSASPAVRIGQNLPGNVVQRVVRPASASLVGQGPTANNGGAIPRQRYFIQKAPMGVTKRELPPVTVRQVARPYPAPGERRMVAAAGQPVKYYVAAGAGGQTAPQYKPAQVLAKMGVRPIPPQSGGPRHVYQPVQNQMVQNRMVQQRVYGQQQPGTTFIRKIIRKVILPPKTGSPHPQQNQNQLQGQHPQQQQLVPKNDDSPVISGQAAQAEGMPMSSRQSDLLQDQQQDPQFDPYYDPMDMTDEQIMQYQ